LTLSNGKIVPANLAYYKTQVEFYDQRQLAMKILLNALYGAIGNAGSRFSDQRIAQSITLVGRQIARHMAALANQLFTGKYEHTGGVVQYGDTDSGYFTLENLNKLPGYEGIQLDKDNLVQIADMVAAKINESFGDFMLNQFNVPAECMKHDELGQVIKVARETCALAGIFTRKKRYGLLVFDKEGKRQDKDGKPGTLKITGMETQRSDTPKFIQKFLEECLMMALAGKSEIDLAQYVGGFRGQMREKSPWMLGTPKRVNKLSYYEDLINKNKPGTVPGHARAAVNWNTLRDINGDRHSTRLSDGHKVVVCKLKKNAMGLVSIAYPADETNLPDWFKKLPFDCVEMEASLIDQKLNNILGILNWDLAERTSLMDDDELFGE